MTDRDELIQQFQQAEKIAKIGSWQFDPGKSKIYWTPQMYELFGESPEQGPPSLEKHKSTIHPSDRELWEETVARCLQDGEPYVMVFRSIRGDGVEVWIEAHGEGVRGSNGEVSLLRGTCRDVTREKHLERENHRLQLLNQKIEHFSKTGGWEYDLEAGKGLCTGQVYEILGLDEEVEFSKAELLRLLVSLSEEDQSLLLKDLERCWTLGSPFDSYYSFFRTDGSRVWLHVYGEAICNFDGEIVKLRGILQDISAQKVAEASLSQASDLFQCLFHESSSLMAVLDRDGRVLVLNGLWSQLMGRSDEELLRTGVHSYLGKKSQEELLAIMNTIDSKSRSEVVVENPIALPHGEQRTFSWLLKPMAEQNFILLVGSDVTELRSAELKRNLTLEALLLGAWSWNMRTGEVEWDEVCYRLFGVNKQEFTPNFETISELLDPLSLKEMHLAIERAIATNGALMTDFRVNRPSGEPRVIACRGYVVKDAQGQPSSLQGINWDITEEVKLKNELQTQRAIAEQSSKLASLGELAAGIGHEINNPLAIVKGFLSSLSHRLKKGELNQSTLLKYFEKMENAVDRISRIVEGLRVFSHSNDERRILSLESEIESILSMVSDLFAQDHLKLRFENRANGPLNIRGNHGRLQQVLMNLLSNARDATEGKAERLVTVVLERIGSQAVVRVIDNGLGISAEIKSKIFQPFFTTKAVQKGTGIGLAMCHSIVGEHEGRISVNSEPGQGAEFVLEFPLAMDTMAPVFIHQKASLAEPAETRFVGRALLVDDEEVLVGLLADLLTSRGMDVTVFYNGRDALNHWLKNKSAYQFLYTDIKMPLMDGLELVQQINGAGGEHLVKVVMTAGVQLEDAEVLKRNYGIDTLLFKPYSEEQVFEVLARHQKRSAA